MVESTHFGRIPPDNFLIHYGYAYLCAYRFIARVDESSEDKQVGGRRRLYHGASLTQYCDEG